MWPLAMLALALISTTLWYKTRAHSLDVLALISGGAAVMFLVDSLYAYIEEGTFVELSWDAAVLSALLVIAAIVLWLAVLTIRKIRAQGA